MKFYTNSFLLRKLKKMSNYLFFVLVILVIQGKFVDAQQIPDKLIKGKVTDESGLPLPGVSIIVKGTTNSTSTNKEGNGALLNKF